MVVRLFGHRFLWLWLLAVCFVTAIGLFMIPYGWSTADSDIPGSIINIVGGLVFLFGGFHAAHVSSFRIAKGMVRVGHEKVALSEIEGIRVGWAQHDGLPPFWYHLPVMVLSNGQEPVDMEAMAMYWWRSKPTLGTVKRCKKVAALLGVPYLGIMDLES